MNDKTDNPEMNKVYKRLSMSLRQLEDIMENVKELMDDIDTVYVEVGYIYNKLESIEHHLNEYKPE